MKNITLKIFYIFSPTRFIIDLWKKGGREHRTSVLRCWSFRLFIGEGLAIICLSIIPAKWESDLVGWWNGFSVIFFHIGLLFFYYGFSRVNEISYAFYNDSLSPFKETNLNALERIKMAMRSYLGLVFNFALIYYFLPCKNLFNIRFNNFFDAFYFSGVTITTLGYSDVRPIYWVSRLFTLYEVLAGILLVALAIATYVSNVKINKKTNKATTKIELLIFSRRSFRRNIRRG